MKIPTLTQVENYVREKSLNIDPKVFIDHYEAADPPWTYYDRRDKQKPVRNWKQKALMWDRMKLERGKVYRCYCGKPGVYIIGNDAVGFPIRRCIDHKPKPKPCLPAEMTANVLKMCPQGDKRSLSDKQREQRKGLGL